MGNVTYTSIYNRIKALAGIPSPDANANAHTQSSVNPVGAEYLTPCDVY